MKFLEKFQHFFKRVPMHDMMNSVDEEEKDTRGKWERTKEAIAVSWRLVKLVFKVDPFLFSLTFITTLIPAVIPFVNAYLYKLIIDLVVEAVRGSAFNFRTLYLLI